MKLLKEYTLVSGELYKHLSGKLLARCIGENEAKEQMEETHKAMCRVDKIVSLYHRLQRKGCFGQI